MECLARRKKRSRAGFAHGRRKRSHDRSASRSMIIVGTLRTWVSRLYPGRYSRSASSGLAWCCVSPSPSKGAMETLFRSAIHRSHNQRSRAPPSRCSKRSAFPSSSKETTHAGSKMPSQPPAQSHTRSNRQPPTAPRKVPGEAGLCGGCPAVLSACWRSGRKPLSAVHVGQSGRFWPSLGHPGSRSCLVRGALTGAITKALVRKGCSGRISRRAVEWQW